MGKCFKGLRRALSVFMTVVVVMGSIPADAFAQMPNEEERQVEPAEEVLDQTTGEDDLEAAGTQDEAIDVIAGQDERLVERPEAQLEVAEGPELAVEESADTSEGEALLAEEGASGEPEALSEPVVAQDSVEDDALEAIEGQADQGTSKTSKAATPVPISKAKAAKIAAQPYTGKAAKPAVSLTYGGTKLKAGTDYRVSYASNKKPGTATVTVAGRGNFAGTRTLKFKIVAPSVSYGVHRQTYGDQDDVANGVVAGTTGEGKRLEAVWISLGKQFPVAGGITYRTHVQTYGWQSWVRNGAVAGTRGKGKRLEAVQVKLTGKMAKKYDVWYRAHAQKVGWTAWARNGQACGTVGLGWRLEALQVLVRPKGQRAPGKVAGVTSNVPERYIGNPGVRYRALPAGGSWTKWASGSARGAGGGGAVCALQAKLGTSAPSGSLRSRLRVRGGSWSAWAKDGATSGDAAGTGADAVQMKLSGRAAVYFDVWYRVSASGLGWLGWARNGKSAGTGGSSRPVESIQVAILPKGASAPGPTNGPYRLLSVRKGLEAAEGSRSVTGFGGFEPSDVASDGISEAIDEIRKNGYDVGLIMMDLTSCKGVAYNCDGLFYGASSIKAPYITSVVSQNPEALTKYQYDIQQTLFYSWDYHYKQVYYGYGKDPMRTWCADSGARASIAESLPWAYYTARDLALMWGHSYVWYEKSEAVEELGTWCERPNISTIHDTLGGKYRTRSKGGWIAAGGRIVEGLNGGGPEFDVTDDGGIVYAKNGAYVMAIMSSIPADHGALHTLTAAIDAAHDEM